MENVQTPMPHVCPSCGSTRLQKMGFTGGGSQRYVCADCKKTHTPNPKKWAYTDQERQNAFRLLGLGTSARGVGKFFKMSKSNVLRWAVDAQKKG